MAMRRRTRHWLLAGLATVALAIPALGQNAPESLLPPGFGEPVPAEAPRPQQPGPVQGPVAQPTPDKTASLPELLLNAEGAETGQERTSTRLNSRHYCAPRMRSYAFNKE